MTKDAICKNELTGKIDIIKDLGWKRKSSSIVDILSYDSWNKLIQYGISRGEFKQVNINGVFDVILFAYQGVRMYSRLMPIPKETPERIVEQIKSLLLI